VTATIIPLPKRKPHRPDLSGLSLSDLYGAIGFQQGLLSSLDLDTVRGAGRKLDALRAEIARRHAPPPVARSIDDLWPAWPATGEREDET
jgi:hypothetical protein